MNELLPDFEAFYSSLSDAQKASLQPAGKRGDRMGRSGGDDRNAPGRSLRGPAPGRN